MQTTISEVGPAERELEITASADELAPRLKKALRAQRGQVDMKGFRKGKVPLSLVKKMYGQALGLQVAEEFVQDAYEEALDEHDDLDVLGRPEMTDFDYEVDGDLRAVLHLAVRPAVELKDVSGEEIMKLNPTITDDEVDHEIDELRRREATLIPKEDEGAEEEDFVLFDLQELDPETDQPLIGQRDEDQSLFLDEPELDDRPMLAALKEALLGVTAGEAVRFTYAHDQAHGGHAEGHPHRFEVRLKDVKRRELPEVDDAFVREITDGEIENVGAFRADVRTRLEGAWGQRSQELLQGQIIERMLDLHPVPVPDALVETYLDSFVEDVKRRNDGNLPEDFDEAHFRNVNRDEARQQAHWMLLREQVVEEEELETDDDDLAAFFEEQAEGDEKVTAEQLRHLYQSMPDMMGQIRQQVLGRQVFEVLEGRFQVVEKDREAFEEAVEAEQPVVPDEASGGASPLVG